MKQIVHRQLEQFQWWCLQQNSTISLITKQIINNIINITNYSSVVVTVTAKTLPTIETLARANKINLNKKVEISLHTTTSTAHA